MTVFAKGAWYALDALCDSGYDVVGLDWLHDPAEAMRIANSRVVLQGNADPGILYGRRDVITAEVKNMVAGFGGGKQGWIANLGHGKCHPLSRKATTHLELGITPLVNPDDLKFYFEEIHRMAGN